MNAVITGLGRINLEAANQATQPGFATHHRGKQAEAQGIETGIKTIYAFLKDEAVFVQPVKYFGKFDATSKMALCSCGLALWDAGATVGAAGDWGIIGANQRGCLTANLDYFNDYVDNGRTKARGKLFVYTLPSTPLAETAIAFGCRGPQVYMQSTRPDLSQLLDQAAQIMADSDAGGMLAVYAEDATGLALALQKKNNPKENKTFLSVSDAIERYGDL